MVWSSDVVAIVHYYTGHSNQFEIMRDTKAVAVTNCLVLKLEEIEWPVLVINYRIVPHYELASRHT